MKKIIIVLAIIFCCVVGSCSSKRVPQIEKTVIDSVVVNTTVRTRDTTIVVPGSQVQLKLPVFELSEKPIFKKSGNATITLSKDKNEVITAQANCDSLQFQLQLRDSIIERLEKRFESITSPPVVEEKTNWIERTLQIIGFLVLLILGIFGTISLIAKFRKP